MLSTPSDLAKSILEAAPDAMIIVDSTGCIRYANRQASALFGYSHDEIIDRKIEQLLPEGLRTRHVGHTDHCSGNLRFRPMGRGLDLCARGRDGKEFPVEISSSSVRDGERILIAAAIRDMTDRKAVETELIEARESADRANRDKDRFLATASHDLRQPLQTVTLLNGALRRMAFDAESAEALAQQERAIGAMSRLLDALLDISKLESGALRPQLEDFKIAYLFDEMRREFAGPAADKGLQFQIDGCTATVRSDSSMVGQILRNLVSNAIKYTRAGQVHLRCLYESTAVRIDVHDTGIGISTDKIPSIFDEFYQIGVPTNSSRDGYGLGLSIVKRVARLLNVKLDVESEPGIGSTFSFWLPTGTGQANHRPESPRHFPVGSVERPGLHVLLVEDDAAVRAATSLLIKGDGYRTTAVASSAEALEQVRQGDSFDLLIVDYHLAAGEIGLELIADVRAAVGTPLKAILLTGDTSSAIRELPIDSNLQLASKPIDAETFLTLIKSVLNA
jgi:two-component system, sensor histidine kinase